MACINTSKCEYCGVESEEFCPNGPFTCSKCMTKDAGNNSLDIMQESSSDEEGSSLPGYFHFDQKASRDNLVRFIITGDCPLSLVESSYFREFASGMQPLVEHIDTEDIKNDIMNMYNLLKLEVQDILHKAPGRVAITTEMWTSCENLDSVYMAIVVQFIDESGMLQKRLIRFAHVPFPDDPEFLSELLMNCFLEWNVDHKLSCILTAGSSSNNGAYVEIIRDHLSAMDPLILDGEMFHLSCYINILNSIAHDLLEVVKDATEKVHDNICFWSSTGRVEKFEEAARKLQIPSSEKLILDDDETEWILSDWVSTYHMLRCAMKYKDVLSRLIQQEEASWALPSLPSCEEWKMAEEVCDKLEIFYETTKLFSRSKCPTPNLLFPYCCKIMLKLKEWVKSDNEVIPGLANGMLAKFECYWRSCSFPLSLAVVLDPRYKLKIIEFYYSQLFVEADEEIGIVQQGLHKLFMEYQNQSSELDDLTPASSTTRTARSKDADFPELEMFLCLGQSNNNLTHELDYYLEQPLVPRDPGFDVLEWWNTHAIRYPTLMLIARDVLAIPISSDSSKSAFMMGDRLLKPHHSELLPETLEALMCTRDWLAAEDPGSYRYPIWPHSDEGSN